jgi:hypothetical protein
MADLIKMLKFRSVKAKHVEPADKAEVVEEFRKRGGELTNSRTLPSSKLAELDFSF